MNNIRMYNLIMQNSRFLLLKLGDLVFISRVKTENITIFKLRTKNLKNQKIKNLRIKDLKIGNFLSKSKNQQSRITQKKSQI